MAEQQGQRREECIPKEYHRGVAVVFDVVPGDVDDSTFCTSTGNGMLLPLRRGTRMCPYGT